MQTSGQEEDENESWVMETGGKNTNKHEYRHKDSLLVRPLAKDRMVSGKHHVDLNFHIQWGE